MREERFCEETLFVVYGGKFKGVNIICKLFTIECKTVSKFK